MRLEIFTLFQLKDNTRKSVDELNVGQESQAAEERLSGLGEKFGPSVVPGHCPPEEQG